MLSVPGYDILALAHNAFRDDLVMEKNPNSPYGSIKIITAVLVINIHIRELVFGS